MRNAEKASLRSAALRVVIVDPEIVESGYQSPMNWTGKRRGRPQCPENLHSGNRREHLFAWMVKGV